MGIMYKQRRTHINNAYKRANFQDLVGEIRKREKR